MIFAGFATAFIDSRLAVIHAIPGPVNNAEEIQPYLGLHDTGASMAIATQLYKIVFYHIGLVTPQLTAGHNPPTANATSPKYCHELIF